MKSKTFVMMFVAIGCGLVAAYLTARITAKQAAPDTVPVLVAKEKIKAGDVLKDPEKLFVEMRYPVGSTPNAISSLEELKGKMVNKTIQPGQWLTPDDMSGNFGIELPKGYYAMAVKVSAETGAGGFILPKSRVNVVVTIRPQNQGKPKVVTVLQDVLVLAVDTMSIRPEDKMAVAAMNTALLAVKPADSQKLTLAQSMGELRLVLRSHDDENKVPLAPLQSLETDDNGFSDGTDGGTYKVAVAKEDIEPGTVLDDLDRYFEVKSMAAAPDKAIPAEDLKSIKGKTLKVSLFKDAVVTAKYFDDKIPVAEVKATPEPKRHVLFIQNGGNAPIRQVYEDGVTKGDDAAGTVFSPVDPESEPKPSAAAKPVAKKKLEQKAG